ncbi:MAG TPA: beta-galactosidase, partial [Bacteroides sp.]|nr:beta-galactosidase [Bacteroides sp.]
MSYRLLGIFAITLFLTACSQSYTDHTETIDLSGTWKFQLDPENVGMKDEWYKDGFNDSVTLPGTTDENKKGVFLDEKAVDRVSRVWYWEGAAWYQKEVDIPEHWAGKNVKLLLERTKDTYVWFDDINCGYENTLSA